MATVQRYVNTGSSSGGDGTTNATTGASRAYVSLFDWEANAGGSATDDYIVDCCGSGADTTVVNVDFTPNITTGTILIRGNRGEADGFYDGDEVISTSHYRLSPGSFSTILLLSETKTTVDGIQVESGHTGANGIAISTSSGANTVRKCRVRNSASCDFGIGTAGTSIGFNVLQTFENNLIVGFDSYGIYKIITNFFTGDLDIYHNTIYGDGAGGGILYGSSGAGSGQTFNIKGNAVGNCGSGNDLVKNSGASTTVNTDTNAFEYSESTTNEVALGTLTDAWTSPGSAQSDDFTVKDASSSLDDTVPGTLVSDDIRDVTRSNYSIGAFEFVSGGGGGDEPIIRRRHIYHR